MLNIGCHLSISKGYYKTALEAISIGANTFQFFPRNPRGGKAKDLDLEDIEKLQNLMKEHNFAPLFVHGAYTMNLASDKEHVREFAKEILKDDLDRVEKITNCYYIFHPGSHVGQGVQKGIELIIDALNEIIPEDNKVTILLEGMSGKGTEIGRSMEELKLIIDGVNNNENLGICIDTCHLYSSGYDIVNDLDGVLEEIDDIVGLEKLKAVHLNDSKVEFNSNKDRHEIIGDGTIGKDTIIKVINHPLLRNLPFNLETPNDVKGHKEEIKILRSEYK
ncbi:deoxyribonuclease IV [Tissierella creatinophila]|uniref:Probable endonuclease 4 n=1 Tax=Tissierella creatinophila DSM 6911 TaxID=1123403 RepID=A0A1U7M963_TISCR|nr:deoxyribonuclease IV [Tissierella creatinophila]OLS03863.1 putative endonuclease 4 [Tissierella creatinophila DSM 6911]